MRAKRLRKSVGSSNKGRSGSSMAKAAAAAAAVGDCSGSTVASAGSDRLEDDDPEEEPEPMAMKDEDEQDLDDDWMFDSVVKYHHLCMYKMDAFPLCLDVDGAQDQVALGVSRQFTPAAAAAAAAATGSSSSGDGGGGGGNAATTASTGSIAPSKTVTTYQLLILKIPDKISARKSEKERDLSNNRDLKYLAGSDLGEQQLRQVRFYDSETCFALQTSTLTCWKITQDTDILTHLFSIRFDEEAAGGKLCDLRISHNKLSVYLGFDYQFKIRHYKVYRETTTADQSGPADGPLRLRYDDSWSKSNLYFKEGNLAGADTWFWNVIFDNDRRSRPEVYVDGRPVDFETSRSLFGPEWANPATGNGTGNGAPNPQLGWYYRPNMGLYAATVRLKESAADPAGTGTSGASGAGRECRMVTFRSRQSTRWDCRTARLGFAIHERQVIHPDARCKPEVKVFPEPSDSELNSFRVVLGAANSVFCYLVTSSDIYELFHHDAHKANVMRLSPYPANPDVIFSTDSDMNVHVWWPARKTAKRLQPCMALPAAETTAFAVATTSTAAAAASVPSPASALGAAASAGGGPTAATGAISKR